MEAEGEDAPPLTRALRVVVLTAGSLSEWRDGFVYDSAPAPSSARERPPNPSLMRFVFIARRISDPCASNPASGNFKRKPDSKVFKNPSHIDFIPREDVGHFLSVIEGGDEPSRQIAVSPVS
jgi:hypothetical protein